MQIAAAKPLGNLDLLPEIVEAPSALDLNSKVTIFEQASARVGRIQALRMAEICPWLVSKLAPLSDYELGLAIDRGYGQLLRQAARVGELRHVGPAVLISVLAQDDFDFADWLARNATFSQHPISYVLSQLWSDSPHHGRMEVYLPVEVTTWLDQHFGASYNPDEMSEKECVEFQDNLGDYFNHDEPNEEVARWLIKRSACPGRFGWDYDTIVYFPAFLGWLIDDGRLDPKDGKLIDVALREVEREMPYANFRNAPESQNAAGFDQFRQNWRLIPEKVAESFAGYAEWRREGYPSYAMGADYYNYIDSIHVVATKGHYGIEVVDYILNRLGISGNEEAAKAIRDALFEA